MNREEAYKKLDYFMQGNQAAIDLCLNLNYVGELWDDLVDRDKDRTVDEVNRAFEILAVEIPRNPFYRQFFSDLQPLVQSAILAWHDSNELSRGTMQDKHMAFMLKQDLSRIFNYCAFLVGGREWYLKVGADICRMYEDTFEEYLEETRK